MSAEHHTPFQSQEEKAFLEPNVQWSAAILIILISGIFIFPPEYLIAKQISKYAVHWMFLCMLMGVIFMLLDLEKLMFTAFGCAGLLALMLLYSYNTSFSHAEASDQDILSIGFVNPSWSTDEAEGTQRSLTSVNTDVLLLEEVSPGYAIIMDSLMARYPYHAVLSRADAFGKAIFSKYRLDSVKTTDILNRPVLMAQMKLTSEKRIYLAVVNELPPLTMNDFKKLSMLLTGLSGILGNIREPVILAANLNLALSSPEIRDFRLNSGMTPSRRDNQDGKFGSGFMSLFNTPKNEIFYTSELECVEFDEVYDANSKPLGISGKYQVKTPHLHNIEQMNQ